MNGLMRIFTLLLICLIFSCGSDESVKPDINREKEVPEAGDSGKIINKVEFDDTLILPEGLHLDSLRSYYKTPRLEVYKEFIQTDKPELRWVLKIIEDSISREIKDYVEEWNQYLKEVPDLFEGDDRKLANFMTIIPALFYFDSAYFSMTIQLYRYDYGAAHGYTYYKSFNFDLKSRNPILFSDLFELKSSDDSTFLIRKINESNEIIELEKLFDFGFYMTNEIISFNFDSYEVCAYALGAPKGVVRKSELKEIISKNYK